jgi:small subunit ribosomal protein S6e
MKKGYPCFRPRRKGERKRKSVRGCIVSSELSVLSLVIVKKGESEIPGLTDVERPKRYGPKRANKIRKLFNLTRRDDVTKFVIKTKVTKKSGKVIEKSPKIQRLTTPVILQRKMRVRRRKKRQFKKNQAEAKVYNELVLKISKDKKNAERLAKMRKRSRSRLSSRKN